MSKQTQTSADISVSSIMSQATSEALEIDEMVEGAVAAGEVDANFEEKAKDAQKPSETEAVKPSPRDVEAKKRAEELEARIQAPVEHQAGDLKKMIGRVTEKQAKDMSDQVTGQFANRQDYELKKNPHNEGIVKKLKGYSAKMGNLKMCSVLIATKTDADFINREIASGSRFNVYAIDKVRDLVQALETGTVKNAINNAITRSLFNFRAAGELFTGEMAAAAASDKIRVANKKLEKLLVRHTVGGSTAATQSSSTMSALSTLGIVENRGSRRAPVWVLLDTPQARRLEEIIAA